MTGIISNKSTTIGLKSVINKEENQRLIEEKKQILQM
jgi:hypothetical protein